MRILQIVEATTAGVRRHVSTLASAIDQRRYQFLVACPAEREQAYGDRFFVNDLQSLGIPVRHLPLLRSIAPQADTQAVQQLARLIREEQIDLVHAHSSKAGVLGRLAARLAGVPSIYTPHSLYFLGVENPLKRRIFLQIEQAMGRVGDRVIAVSPGEYELMRQFRIAPASKIVCIENGIAKPHLSAGFERAALRAQLGAQGEAPLIGTIARLAEQKDPRFFLEAAAHMLGTHPEARFVWCGSGELAEQALQWVEELGIGHAVRLLGHREHIADILAALDVFWLCSRYEGLPTVLLEAMALHVPVVATDVVGNRDTLRGQAGLLVPPGDPARFARATAMLLGNEQRREAFIEMGARWVSERWDARRMAHETTDLYDNVVQLHHVNIPPAAQSEPRSLAGSRKGER